MPPRLAIRPPSPEGRGGQGVRTSRRLRRLTTARPGLGLVLGLERPSHVAGTLPRSHQLGIIPEPIPDHLVQQAELLADVRGNHLQIGARAYMLGPACAGRLQRVLVLGTHRSSRPPLACRERLCYILNHMVQYMTTRLDTSFAAL